MGLIRARAVVVLPASEEPARPSAARPQEWRRLSRLSRRAVAAAGEALDACPELDPARLPLIWATGYGELRQAEAFLTRIEEEGVDLASPQRFQSSVYSAAAGAISLCFGLRGPCETLSAGPFTGLRALDRAALLLALGAPAALVVAGDEPGPWVDRARSLWGEPPLQDSLCALVLSGAGPGRVLKIEEFQPDSDGSSEELGSPTADLARVCALLRGPGGVLSVRDRGLGLRVRVADPHGALP